MQTSVSCLVLYNDTATLPARDATPTFSFYDTHNQLEAHLNDFLKAYNFARRLKTLNLNPIHQMPRRNNITFPTHSPQLPPR